MVIVVALAILGIGCLWYVIWVMRGFVASSPEAPYVVPMETEVELIGRSSRQDLPKEVSGQLTVAHIDGNRFALNTQNWTVHVSSAAAEPSDATNVELLAGAIALHAAQQTRQILPECPEPVVRCQYRCTPPDGDRITELKLTIHLPHDVAASRIDLLQESIQEYLAGIRSVPIDVAVSVSPPPREELHLPLITP